MRLEPTPIVVPSCNELEREERKQKVKGVSSALPTELHFFHISGTIKYYKTLNLTLYFANNWRFLPRGEEETHSTAKKSVKRPFQRDSDRFLDTIWFLHRNMKSLLILR